MTPQAWLDSQKPNPCLFREQHDNAVAAALRNGGPGWQRFAELSALLLENDPNGHVTVDGVLTLCDVLNIQTVAQAFLLAQALRASPAGSLDRLSHRLRLDTAQLESVSKQDLWDSLRDKFRLEPYVLALEPARVAWVDRYYKMLTSDAVEQITTRCPAHLISAAPERMDCDDFADVALGWCAAQGLGATSKGRVSIIPRDKNDNPVGEHICCLVWADGEPFLWEPQEGPNKPRLHGPEYGGGFQNATHCTIHGLRV